MRRRIGLLCASGGVALTCLVLAGAAQAQPTQFSGVVPNGGCGSDRSVTVSGPSRIEAHVASTAGAANVYAEIVSSSGAVLGTGQYDTSSGGTYGIRVCSYYDDENGPYLQWSGEYGTGPAGQPALPRTVGQVLAATTTLAHNVHGSVAIRTRGGLAWFTVKLDRGLGVVKVYDPQLRKHFLYTRAHVTFGTNLVSMREGGMMLTLRERSGSTSTIAFRSPRFRASGRVVRGNYLIV